MGTIFSQTKHVIYLQDNKGKLIPMEYSLSLQHLRDHLSSLYEYNSTYLLIQEASEHVMHVGTETSFRALVPKHKTVEPNINVYYIVVNLPLTFVF
jgi:hypothetical protein